MKITSSGVVQPRTLGPKMSGSDSYLLFLGVVQGVSVNGEQKIHLGEGVADQRRGELMAGPE